MTEKPTDRGPCPRCGEWFTAPPALSRVDNESYVCERCGQREALYAFAHPGAPLPPLGVAL